MPLAKFNQLIFYIMPNHIRNRVEIIAPETQIKRVFAFIKGEEGAIDFNSIIPEPSGIDKATSGNTQDVKEYGWIWKLRYGYSSWYEWRCDNWGTKWNAYEIEYESGSSIIEFDTAWSAPHHVIERLAVLFPDVLIEHRWADEDTGCNCGICKYENGERIETYLPDDGSAEAFELAFDLRPYLADEFVLVDGEYRWHEDC